MMWIKYIHIRYDSPSIIADNGYAPFLINSMQRTFFAKVEIEIISKWYRVKVLIFKNYFLSAVQLHYFRTIGIVDQSTESNDIYDV